MPSHNGGAGGRLAAHLRPQAPSRAEPRPRLRQTQLPGLLPSLPPAGTGRIAQPGHSVNGLLAAGQGPGRSCVPRERPPLVPRTRTTRTPVGPPKAAGVSLGAEEPRAQHFPLAPPISSPAVTSVTRSPPNLYCGQERVTQRDGGSSRPLPLQDPRTWRAGAGLRGQAGPRGAPAAVVRGAGSLPGK